MKTADSIIKKTQSDYNIIASHFGRTRKVIWEDLKPFLIKVKKREKVLDLGCGNGRIFSALKKKSVGYVGVDFSESLIAQARKRFPKVKFILADLTKNGIWQELEKEKFDKVFLIAVLHHFPTSFLQKKLLRRINRALKKEGMLFLTVWNLYQIKFWKKHLEQLPKKVVSGFKFKWLWVPYRLQDGRGTTKGVNRFCYGFGKKELEKLLKEQGFKVKKIYYSQKGKKKSWLLGSNLCVEARKV